MYSKTHTRAIVLGHNDLGETSRMYRLFTEDMGVVFARCQSSRSVMSRHRYGLQLFSVSDVSLVRTRAGWRVTNVSPIDSLLARHKNKSREHALILRVMSLVRRFVVGEEKGGALFNVVWNGLSFLDTHELQPETSRWFEALFVLRILNVLGYVRHDDQYSLHLSEINTFTKESVESFASIYKVAIAEINRAIEASQL